MRRSAVLVLVSLLSAWPAHAERAIDLAPVAGFVPNEGQAPPEVLYYASGPHCAIYLTRDAIVVDAWESARSFTPGRARGATPLAPDIHRRGHAIWYRFAAAADRAPVVQAEGALAPHLNFLLGNDPSAWHAGVPVYERVTYRGLWPGVDLVCDSRPGGLAFALNAVPGADPGAARVERDAGDGTLPEELGILDLPGELARDAGSGVPDDDPGTLLWSTFLGGTSEEIGWSVAVDTNGKPVVAGLTISTFFPTTPGAYDRTYAGFGDVFVSKLSADGSALIWSTFLGGTSTSFDYGYAVALDGSNRPVVTGYTFSSDFPITPGAWEPMHHGAADVFVTKLEAGGGALQWSTFLGGDSYDIGYTLDLDAAGNVAVAGRTLSLDFLATFGAYDMEPNGEEDAFIAKLSAAGNNLQWMTLLGGDLYDGVESIALDASGEIFLGGYTASTNFPGGGAAQGLYDAFVALLTSGGDALPWSVLIGGSAHEYCTALALDLAGNPVIVGSTGSFDFPVTAGAYDQVYNGDDDVFVAKVNIEDGTPLWATFVGGSTPVYEIAMGVAVDAFDRPVVAGATPSGDFPTTAGGYDTSHNGASDVFVLALEPDGSALDWSTFLGGGEDDYAFALALSPTGNAVVTGSVGTGFPVTAGAYDVGYNGDISDVFVARLAPGTSAASVEGMIAGASLALRITPNPSAASANITFALPAPATPVIEIFDAAGRRRATLPARAMGAGQHVVTWNGLDASGHPLPAGVYQVRVAAGNAVATSPAVLLR